MDSNSLRDDFRKDGYSREEAYFYKLNRELIGRRRRQVGHPTRGERGTLGERVDLSDRVIREHGGEREPRTLWNRIRAFFGRADTNWRP